MTTLSIFLIQTLIHTPRWVWLLLLALLALGALQMRSRTVTLWRAVLLPMAMTGLSLYGVLGSTSVQPAAGLVWAAGIAAALGLHGWLGVPRGARWRPATRDFSVPGSWVPLALMLAIFTPSSTLACRSRSTRRCAAMPSSAARMPCSTACSAAVSWRAASC